MKLSVITINYNNIAGLEKTFKSVWEQTLNDFEYIVIDGASNDGSEHLVLQHADKISYWVSEPDKGVYDAMNKGILKATGEYCIFMNSGDCFYSNDVVENVTPHLNGTDIIYGNTHYTDGKIRYSKDEPPYFSFFYISGWAHQATFIKTELLKKYMYDDSYKIVSDWKFLLQVVIKDNCTCLSIDQNISLFDATGISSTNNDLIVREKKEVLNEMFTERYIQDYQNLIYGRTWDEKLYIEMRNSKFHKLLYTFNVLLIKCLSFLRKGPAWIDKYPISL